jgi:hypothetical protein
MWSFEAAVDLPLCPENHAASARKFSYPASPEESVGMQQFDNGDRALPTFNVIYW